MDFGLFERVGMIRLRPMDEADGRFADNAKEFYLKEYEAQRTQMGWLLQDYRSLERNAVVAVGVTWGWLFKQDYVPPKWAWFAPCLFAVLGSLRALGISKTASTLTDYIKRLEDAFSHAAGDPGGWEHFSGGEGRGQVKAAYLFWIVLILATFGVGLYTISN